MPKELEDLTKEQLIELIKNQQKEADELNAAKLKACFLGAIPGALTTIAHPLIGVPLAIGGCTTGSGLVDAYDMATNSRGSRAVKKAFEDTGKEIGLTNPQHGLPEQPQQPAIKKQSR